MNITHAGSDMLRVSEVMFPFVLTSTILSLLCSIGILTCFIKFPRERNMIRHLLLAMSLGDCLASASNLLGAANFTLYPLPNSTILINSNHTYNILPSRFCVTQSFFSCTGTAVSIVYNIFLPVYFYIVATKNGAFVMRIRMTWIHAFCWTIPLLVAVIAASTNVLGPNYLTVGRWCWVSGQLPAKIQIAWMSLLGEVWEMVAYVVAPLFFYLGYYDLYKKRKADSSPFACVTPEQKRNHQMWFREEDKNYLIVPPLYYLLRIWGTIRFVIYAYELYNNKVVGLPRAFAVFLFVMQSLLAYSQAIWNFVLFCIFDATIRSKMWAVLRRMDTEDDTEVMSIMENINSPRKRVSVLYVAQGYNSEVVNDLN